MDAIEDTSPERKVESSEDHVAHIAELARSLRTTSPSGAESISDKILYHVNAIQNPDEHNEAVAKAQEAEDEADARRAAERDKLKTAEARVA